MLRLNTEQHEWLLARERQRLAQALAQSLAEQWPALAQKLGERIESFVDTALQQAQRHGLSHHRHAARLVNLWCLWGPAFEDKPGFEWAAAILKDPRRSPAVKVQQLVLQSHDLLTSKGAAVKPETLDQSDLAMTLAAQQPRAASWVEQPSDAAEPRVACDMTAFDLALGDQAWRHEYRLSLAGQVPVASRVPLVAEPQRYRVDKPVLPGTPVAARQIAALAYPVSAGDKAWLHVRCAVDTVCHEHIHPRVDLKSDQGGRVLQGQAARLVKWPLYRADDPPPTSALVPQLPPSTAAALKPGAPVSTLVPGGGLVRQRMPSHVALSATTCGLRRAGAPLGAQDALITVFPAEQWLAEFKAMPQPEWLWPAQGDRPVAPPLQVKLACDGQPLGTPGWVEGWGLLGPALVAGVEGWWQALQRSEALQQLRIHLHPRLMHGHSLWTWGARESVSTEGSLGFWRAQAEGSLVASGTELNVSGDLVHGEAVGRLRLRAKGETRLDTRLLVDQADPPLAGELAKVKASWRYPFEAELDAVSQPSLQTLSLDPTSPLGALVGEAGLRSRPDGQGFQWYCVLKLEAAQARYDLWDPMRGLQRHSRVLWPETTLLDWSVG